MNSLNIFDQLTVSWFTRTLGKPTAVQEDTLEGNEKMIYEALLKRGASFMQRLSGIIEGASPYDTLIELTEKGLVCADNFLPVRHWLIKENI